MGTRTMTRTGARLRRALGVAAVTTAVAGCTGWGPGGLPGAGPHASVLDGEIRDVDTRRGTIDLRSGYGRLHSVRYHDDTYVAWGRQAYPPSALERGDRVRVWVEVDRRGTPWAERVEVRESVRQRGRGAARPQRLEGRVGALYPSRGSFTLTSPGLRPLVVHLPPRPTRDMLRRLERLRPGDRVRLEAIPLAGGAAELVRFR